MFPKIGVPQNEWFIMENTIKMDDLGGKPPILETPICFFLFSLSQVVHWAKVAAMTFCAMFFLLPLIFDLSLGIAMSNSWW